jgi:hypothetical protein
MDDASVSIWATAVIAGPILLGGAMAYALVRMRLRRRRAAAGNQRSTSAPRPQEDRRR